MIFFTVYKFAHVKLTHIKNLNSKFVSNLFYIKHTTFVILLVAFISLYFLYFQ